MWHYATCKEPKIAEFQRLKDVENRKWIERDTFLGMLFSGSWPLSARLSQVLQLGCAMELSGWCVENRFKGAKSDTEMYFLEEIMIICMEAATVRGGSGSEECLGGKELGDWMRCGSKGQKELGWIRFLGWVTGWMVLLFTKAGDTGADWKKVGVGVGEQWWCDDFGIFSYETSRRI